MADLKIEPITAPAAVDVVSLSYTVAVTSLGMTLVDDEWILVYVACATSGRSLSTTSTGWTEVAELDIASGCGTAVYKCKVASGTVADLVVNLSGAAGSPHSWQAIVVQIHDTDTTDCVLSSATSDAGAAGASFTPASYTPASNDHLVLYFANARNGSSADATLRFKSADVVGRGLSELLLSSGTAFAIAVGSRQQGTAENAAKPLYSGSTLNRLGTIIVAIKPGESTNKARDSRAGVTSLMYFGTHGVANQALPGTWNIPADFCVWGSPETLNGVTVDATVAATVSNSASFWGYSSQLASTVSTSGAWVGGWVATPATTDLTGKLVSIEWEMTFVDSLIGAQGACIAFGDNASANTGNAAVFQLAPKSKIIPGVTYTSVIAVETAATIGTVGAINWATVNKVGLFFHKVGSSVNARYFKVKNLNVLSSTAMTGGFASNPLDIRFLDAALNGWGFRGICNRQGDAVMVKSPVQFGDGTIKTYANTGGTLLNTPEAYGVYTQHLSNIPASTLSVGLYASSSDTINFTASSDASGLLQNYAINASSSASASYDFTGKAFSKWNMTWATNAPVSGAVFSGCGTVAFKGADVTSCTVTACDNAISGTTGAACSFDADGAVVTSSSISCVQADGTSTGYHIELGASVTAITLDSVTFSGTPGTDKVHVKATTGTVTITISGSTNLSAPDITSDGATVVLAAPTPTLSATVLANSRVVLYNNTTAAELDNALVAGTSWSKVIASGASVNDSLTLHVFKEGYTEFSNSFLYSGADASILVTQVTDAVIQAFRTEDSITDYTTITEFNIYAPTIYIRSNDADGTSKISRLAIYYNGVLTTADGARYFRGGMSMLSTGAVRINKSAIALLLENVNATKSLRFSDEITRRLYTDDGTTIIAPSSQPYSIEYAYGGVPDVVETGVSGLTGPESSQLMGLPNASATASAVLSAAQTTPIHANLQQINDVTIVGDGSATPFNV